MKDFSFKYTLTLDELLQFNTVAMMKKTASIRILCVIITVVWAIVFIAVKEFIVAAFAVVFLIMGAVYPMILKKIARSGYKNSYMYGKEIQLEFYKDHMVEKILPTADDMFESEAHYPYNKIIQVLDTDDLFLFFVSPLEAIGVPKNRVSDDIYVKVVGVIAKHLMDKHKMVHTKKSKEEQD